MKKYIYTYLSIVLFGLTACDDIIEIDISKETIGVLSPPDQFVPSTTTVNFLWNPIEGAEEYQLEVVRGRFNNITAFVLDTFVTVNQYTANFTPGEYEWSLRGVNSEYSTDFIVGSFRIDSISDISLNSPMLIFPEEGKISADSSLTLSWETIFGASQYIVQLSTQSNGNIVINDTTADVFYFTGKVLTTNVYTWRVKGINENNETTFTTSSFEIDQVNPAQPTLISPENTVASSVGPIVVFDWQSELDGNGAIDSIYIQKNIIGAAPLGFEVTESDYTSDSLTPGIYTWKVRSIDKAGNKSNFSNEWTFNVQ